MQRVLLAAILTCICACAMPFNLSLGGRKAFYDNSTNSWLCCVQHEQFGQDWTTKLSLDTTAHISFITIDGESLSTDSTVTFYNIQPNKKHLLLAIDTCSGNLVQQHIAFTYLPVMQLNGLFDDEYHITSIDWVMPDSNSTQHMLAKIKHRGATTNTPDKNKRNYHIKFINPDSTKMDRTFFGLRNDNSWILDAGQVDLLRIRNRVANELWLDMATKPYYADREPKALSGVRGEFIELFLNDNYRGIYSLTEAIDRKQLKLAKYDQNDSTFHGMLWKCKYPTDISLMRKDHEFDNNQDTWLGIEVKYPDPDDVMPTNYQPLAQAIRFVINSTHQQFIDHVADFFDIPVIMDYWIFINAMLAVDNGAKNIYWAVYDQTTDQKLTIAPWDLDCTVGQNWINEPPHDDAVVGPNRNLSYFNNLLVRLIENNPDSFSINTVQRYRELRQNLLNADSIYSRYKHHIDYLKQCGAIQRETQRWSGDTDISQCTLDFDAELEYIRQWLHTHLQYLDNTRFRPYVRGDVNRDGLVDIADINYIINKILKAGDHPVWYEDLSRDFIYDISDLNQLINIMINK